MNSTDRPACNLLRRMSFLGLATTSLLVGCSGDPPVEDKSPEAAQVGVDQSEASTEPTGRARGKPAAIKAKDALAMKLSGRLMEAMTGGGPAAAIQVCSEEAMSIANEVGEEQGVQIGRTSFKLRNAKNTPPEWASDWIAEKASSPQFKLLESGATAALFPILLQPQCTMCHGEKEALSPEISGKLAELYPDDRATGFAAGDLRGWFWVEVPSEG